MKKSAQLPREVRFIFHLENKKTYPIQCCHSVWKSSINCLIFLLKNLESSGIFAYKDEIFKYCVLVLREEEKEKPSNKKSLFS